MNTIMESLPLVLSRSGLSEILIGSTLKGAVVLLVCFAILYLWKRNAAATRHLILMLGLASCLTIPMVSAGWIVFTAAPLHGVRIVETAQSVAGSALGIRALSGVNFALPGWWTLILMIWGVGAVLMTVRTLSGVIRVRFMLRRARPVQDASIHTLFDACLQTTEITRRVRLLAHPTSRIPFTCGLFHPTVVLTQSTLNLTYDEIRRVLLHELAHVRRFDVAANMVAHAAFVLFWFNPLVWLANRQLYHEQERACDDYVLASGEPVAEYAELLLSFARDLRNRVAVVPAGITFVRASSLSHRIQSLFNTENRSRSAGLVTLVTLTLTAVAAVGILSCVRTPTTDKAPTSDLAKADTAPSSEDFVDVDEMPVEISHEDPAYPEAMAEQGLGGIAWVQALVDQNGRVKDARILKSSDHQEFDNAALAAAYKSEYKPAKQGGQPVAVWVSYKVEFKWVPK